MLLLIVLYCRGSVELDRVRLLIVHDLGMASMPRPLTVSERSILDLMLSLDFEGVEELRRQALNVLVTGRCSCGCPTIDLATSPDSNRSRIADSTSPVQARVDHGEGHAPGEFILFLNDGRLSSLEYVYYDEIPNDWPDIDRVTLWLRTTVTMLPESL